MSEDVKWRHWRHMSFINVMLHNGDDVTSFMLNDVIDVTWLNKKSMTSSDVDGVKRFKIYFE